MTHTADKIQIWSDLVLPIVVDKVRWIEIPSDARVKMLAAGVLLERPPDMSACWPEVWPTPAALRARAHREHSTSSQY